MVAKLWQQPTIFFAPLSPFGLFTLVRAFFKRHPMEPGMKAECHIVAIGKKIAKCVRSDLWRSISLQSAYKIARCVAGLRR